MNALVFFHSGKTFFLFESVPISTRSRYGFCSYRAVGLDTEDHRPITGPVPTSPEGGTRSEGACDGDECARHGSRQRRESVACGQGVYRRHHHITTGHEMTRGETASICHGIVNAT